jgi:hypothetical protein
MKPKIILKLSCLRAFRPAQPAWASGERKVQCITISQKGRSGLMQQGRKLSGGQGLPDRAAEEQATKRGGEKRVRKAFRQKFSKSTLCVFRLGRSTLYIVLMTKVRQSYRALR